MKFIVSSDNLLKQLKLVNGVISANTVLPILEDFLFKIDKGNYPINRSLLILTKALFLLKLLPKTVSTK